MHKRYEKDDGYRLEAVEKMKRIADITLQADYHATMRDIAANYIARHRIARHRVARHRIATDYVKRRDIVAHHIARHRTARHRITSQDVMRLNILNYLLRK